MLCMSRIDLTWLDQVPSCSCQNLSNRSVKGYSSKVVGLTPSCCPILVFLCGKSITGLQRYGLTCTIFHFEQKIMGFALQDICSRVVIPKALDMCLNLVVYIGIFGIRQCWSLGLIIGMSRMAVPTWMSFHKQQQRALRHGQRSLSRTTVIQELSACNFWIWRGLNVLPFNAFPCQTEPQLCIHWKMARRLRKYSNPTAHKAYNVVLKIRAVKSYHQNGRHSSDRLAGGWVPTL